jgi:uncharacterized membrane protein YciS (DUF1049 family)
MGVMTKQQLSEHTPWVVKTGVIVGLLCAGAFWFHNRLAAVEVAQAESKTKVDMILDIVRDIRSDIRKP